MVHPTGIEPVSSASETDILSIELRMHSGLFDKVIILTQIKKVQF